MTGQTIERQPILESLVILGAIALSCAVFAPMLMVGVSEVPSSTLPFEGTTRIAALQIARDISYAVPPKLSLIRLETGHPPQLRMASFAWHPGYEAGTSCLMGTECSLPGPFDMILETHADPQCDNGTQWVRYQLAGTTLMRAVVPKRGNPDPAASTEAALAPFLYNVLNDGAPAQTTVAHSAYPHLFAAGGPQPLFTYRFAPGAKQSPTNITEVAIVLVVGGRFPSTAISLAARPMAVFQKE